MDSFKWTAVAISMILGMGVTRLLSGMIVVFRSRSNARLHWIPLAWACCIFVWQLQFWWAIIELPNIVEIWTLTVFLTMIGLTLLLFVAAALILPSTELPEGDSLIDSFNRDGHWALLFLSAYFLLAILMDWWIWNIPLLSYDTALLGSMVILPIVFVACKKTTVKASITVLYCLLTPWTALELSPKSY